MALVELAFWICIVISFLYAIRGLWGTTRRHQVRRVGPVRKIKRVTPGRSLRAGGYLPASGPKESTPRIRVERRIGVQEKAKCILCGDYSPHPCKCSGGHVYCRECALDLGYVCPEDGQIIRC